MGKFEVGKEVEVKADDVLEDEEKNFQSLNLKLEGDATN